MNIDRTNNNYALQNESHNPPEFMTVDEMRGHFKELFKESDHYIRDILTRENGIIRLMEDLNNESDWRKIRGWLQVLNGYVDFLSIEDKKILLNQYYTMLIHPNGTVCRILAGNIGFLLSRCDPLHTDIWDLFLRKMLFTDNSLSEIEKHRIGYAIKGVLENLLDAVNEEEKKAVLNTYVAYFKSTRWDSSTCLSLIKGIKDIPFSMWSNLQRHYIFGFIRQYMSREEQEIRIASLGLLHGWLEQGLILQDDMRQYLEGLILQENVPENENYLILSIWHLIGYDAGDFSSYKQPDSAGLIQKNLSFNTFGSNKIINMRILKWRSQNEKPDQFDLSQYATHLLNVLRLNTDAEIFLPAGEDLVEVMPKLESHQKIEVIQEILKDVELGIDSINYVPSFLGRTFQLLKIENQKDFYARFEELFNSGKADIIKLTLEVIEHILKHLPEYLEKHPEEEKEVLEEFRFFTGLLCRGMAHYKNDLSYESILLMGNTLEHCVNLPESYKEDVISLVRKILIYLSWKDQYRRHLPLILTMKKAYDLLQKEMFAQYVPRHKKVAFFSGSFDPFSRGDRAIVNEILDMGFEVYIYVHEFAWYKNTQPAGIRQEMIHMSIADLRDAYLFPERIPINLKNVEDRRRLRQFFPDREVYLVMGTDGIDNNEAYWEESGSDSIHAFSHILYTNGGSDDMMDGYTIRQIINGDVIFLRMPSYYQKMDARIVRKRVMSGKEIDRYVNDQVCQMILSWKLYKDKPAYKDEAMTRPIGALHTVTKPGVHSLKIFDEKNPENKTECAEIVYKDVRITGLYKEFQNQDIVEILRRKLSGKVARIMEISGTFLSDGKEMLEDYRQIALNEMLAYVQKQEYSYAVCMDGEKYQDLLLLQGFVQIEGFAGCYFLDMTSPIALFSDANLRLKEPFSRNPALQKEIFLGRKKLLQVLTKLYPGNLVLNFEMDILNYRMIQMIENLSLQFPASGISMSGTRGKVQNTLRECICVPFGKALKNVQIPHMITKALNTEKLYKGDLSSFDICEFAEYPSLHSQIRTIRSFSKPIILVDDLYHKGNRMNKIQEILDEENVQIHTVAVGVISGRGHDLAQINHQKVNAVYTIPNLRCWFQESDMYPFIGGDGIESSMKTEEHTTILPSVNSLLPYQMPSYLANSDMDAVYELSKTCLEHTRNLYRIMEELYQQINHRTLTVDKLGDVITEPRCPEELLSHGYDPDRKVSELLEQEISRLARMKHIVK